jgi:hypothetical protein
MIHLAGNSMILRKMLLTPAAVPQSATGHKPNLPDITKPSNSTPTFG